MAVRTFMVGTVLMTVAMNLANGCGSLGQEEGKAKEMKAAKGGEQERATADDSKGEAPGRFGDRLFLAGQTAELAGLKLTVEEVRECRHERDSTQKSLESSDEKLVAARVVFEGTSAQAVTASREFRAHDSERVVFRTASLSGSDCSPTLKHMRLQTGEKSKGWIGFRVPKTVEGLTLRYEHRPPKKRGETGTPAKQYPEFSLST